jgi:hypothetical protein
VSERVTISLPADVHAEAAAAKGDRTWAELVLDGAHADATAGRVGEGQGEGQAEPLTADDVPMVADKVAEQLENRMTRR